MVFNGRYLFNGWTDLVHFWYAHVKFDADSEFLIFKFLSLFVCLLRGVTRSVPCQALMSYKTARVSNVLLVMVADRLWCILFCCIYIMIWNSCQGISTQFFCEVGSLKTFSTFWTAHAQVKNTAHAQNIFFYFFYDRPIWSPKSYHLWKFHKDRSKTQWDIAN